MKDKDKMKKGGLYDGAGSEDEKPEVIFRNTKKNPHTPIDANTGEVLLGKNTKASGEEEDDEARDAMQRLASTNKKIASIHIDFNRDNLLPELNEKDLAEIGAEVNKPVLLKKDIIERNARVHRDIKNSDLESIIVKALYSPYVILSANDEKPYYHFVGRMEIQSKSKPKLGLVLLDIDEGKDNFEIVHVHLIRYDRLSSLLKRSKKKD